MKIKFLILIVILTLNACGQRGPLELPQPQFETPDESEKKKNSD